MSLFQAIRELAAGPVNAEAARKAALKNSPSSVLAILPSIPMGRYIGDKRHHDCHTNAVSVSRKGGPTLYIGYLVFPDMDGRKKVWRMVVHSFNVRDGKVEEHTPVSDHQECHYFGVPAPKGELKGYAYVSNFYKPAWVRRQVQALK